MTDHGTEKHDAFERRADLHPTWICKGCRCPSYSVKEPVHCVRCGGTQFEGGGVAAAAVVVVGQELVRRVNEALRRMRRESEEIRELTRAAGHRRGREIYGKLRQLETVMKSIGRAVDVANPNPGQFAEGNQARRDDKARREAGLMASVERLENGE